MRATSFGQNGTAMNARLYSLSCITALVTLVHVATEMLSTQTCSAQGTRTFQRTWQPVGSHDFQPAPNLVDLTAFSTGETKSDHCSS